MNNFPTLKTFTFNVELKYLTESNYKFTNRNEFLRSLKVLISVHLKYKTLMASCFFDLFFPCEYIFLYFIFSLCFRQKLYIRKDILQGFTSRYINSKCLPYLETFSQILSEYCLQVKLKQHSSTLQLHKNNLEISE